MRPEHIKITARAVAEAEPPGEDFIPDEIPDRLQDDHLINYFRLRFDDRKEYLFSLRNTTGTGDHKEKMKKEADRIEKELARIEEMRSSFASTPENKIAMWHFECYRANWKNHAQKSSADNLKSLENRVLKMELEETAHYRRANLERRILKKVNRWRQAPIPPEPKDPEKEKQAREQKEIERKKAEQEKRKSIKGRLSSAFGKETGAEEEPKIKKKRKKPESEKKERPRPLDSYGLTINQIILQRSDSGCPSSYMSYEIKKPSLYNCLFKEEDNPLHKDKHEPNTIRYFHIPANNMHWIEEAIARYYGETTPGEYNYRQAKNYMKESSDLLCREFWTSLQHGGTYEPVHARHMRAHCSQINPETRCINGRPTNNFIIFMPYLHWESHKRRKKMSEETKKVTDKHLETQSYNKKDLKAEFIKLSEQIKIKHARAMTRFDTTDELKDQKDEKDTKESLIPGLLGQYLLHIAKLYDAMDVEPDVRILRDYLFQNPPLHVRRTLDQSYYWKLPNTDGRDQEQVVYRGTLEGKHLSRTTRVVMVDQLWMYILDENTIITSFPRRWGRNKPDHSGVYKGIRARLDHLKIGQVQSVYDLALLIMNQCSTVFFDLTKLDDERPEVLDIFSNAVSHVSGMKMVAYDTFWRYLDKLNATDRQLADFEITSRSYLKINLEGKLLKEAYDIMEDLRMMASIYAQQLNVLEDFSRHLESMHQADEKRSPKELLNVMLEIKNLLGTRNVPHSAEDPIMNAQHNHSLIQNGVAVLNGMPPGNNTATNASSISESTVEFAKRVYNNITLLRKELQNLEGDSMAVSDQLRDLINLKQQQASIIEAKLALKSAEESVIQGRSVMLFTIVTIIFLPLSFMTSVFGMNAKEFDGPDGANSMSLKHQFKFIFLISVGVIVVSISLAFSIWIRSIIGFFTHITFATIIEYTYIRRLWLWFVRMHTPDGLYETKQNIVRKIYSRKERGDVRRRRDNAIRAERKEKELKKWYLEMSENV